MKTSLAIFTIAITLLIYTALPSADDGYQRTSEPTGWLKSFFDDDSDSDSGDEHLAPATNSSYLEECGSCHFAYQPGLLPARSWQKLMGNLEAHFEDNAELETDVQQALTDYLVKNAADVSRNHFSKKLVRRLSTDETPMRITTLPYFVHEHDEIPTKMVSGNPKLKSLSYCDKCHTRADKGDYSEDNIDVPGYGRWDD